jgi:outer membrane immunogenic protein
MRAAWTGDHWGAVMRKLLIASVGVLSMFLVAGPAAADEFKPAPKRQRAAAPERAAPQRAAPQQQQASNWSGGQAGGSNGVSSVNNSFVEPGAYICPNGTTFNSNCFETPFSFSGHKASYTIGPFLGYRWQYGMYVVGVEGDWSYKKGEDSYNQSTVSTFNTVSFGSPVTYSRTDQFTGSVKQTWDASIRARGGVLVTPWTLVYVTGGVAFTEVSGSFTYTGNAFFCASPTGCAFPAGTASSVANWKDTRVGGTAGLGVEQAIAATGWKWRAEYRYTDFGSYTKNFAISTVCPATSSCASPSSNVSISLRESFHTFRVGLGFDL